MLPIRRMTGLASLLLALGCGDQGLNHAPVFMPLGDRMLAAGEALTVTVVVADPDADTIELALEAAPPGAVFQDGSISWTPSLEDVGVTPFVISARDDGDPPLVGFASFAVMVFDPTNPPNNHQPEIMPVADIDVLSGQTVSTTFAISDPDGDTLTWDEVVIPAGAAFDEITSTFSWTPSDADGGEHIAIFGIVDDGVPALHTRILVSIVVTVPGSDNQPPLLIGVPAPAVLEACTTMIAVFEAYDPEGSAILYTAAKLPPGARFTTADGVGVLTWRPSSEQYGSFVIPIYATDEGNPAMSAALAYTIHVAAPPSMKIDPIGPLTVVGGELLEMHPRFSEHACYALSVATTLPVTWDVGHTTLGWQTEPADFGLYQVSFVLSDWSFPRPAAVSSARVVVSLVEDMNDFAPWATYDVYGDGYTPSPPSYSIEATATAKLLHASAKLEGVTHAKAYRMFERSQIPFKAIEYSFVGNEVLSGVDCGLGGQLAFYDFLVTTPTVTWPAFLNEKPATFSAPVPDSAVAAVTEGVVSLGHGSTTLTLALALVDDSELCSVDMYWDRIVLTPLEALPTP